MASPFAVFRKNQKTLLAVAGVAIIMAFVFGDPLVSYMSGRGSRQPDNPVVVETRYGALRAADLENLRYQRQMVDLFLQKVIEQGTAKQIGQSNIDPRWMQGLLQQQYLIARGRVMGRSVSGPEAEAVETMVVSERAKKMGLVVTDSMINDTIKQLSGDTLSPTELQAIIASLHPQRPVKVPKLFDALRTELLASKYRELFEQTLTDIPPAQRYDYYSRLNRRAKPEVMSLAVADFTSQVADPSDTELKEFYDKYKNGFSDPTSPEPGFKEPKRASFQYFKASVDEVTEKLKADITEEEIREYYEENKQTFIASSFDDPAATPEAADSEPKAEEDEASSEEKPADEKSPAEETPAEEAKPASEEPATESPAEEKPAEEKPAETPDAPEEAPAESPQADLRGSREIRGAGPTFRLVSTAALQDEPAEEAKEEAPAATETPAETPQEKPAEDPAPAADPAKPAEETPAVEDSSTSAEEKPAEEIPADEKSADGSAAGESETPATRPGDEIVEEPPVPETRYEPLEKVQDTIRDTLARQKAAEMLSDQFDELSAKMRRYTDDSDIYTTEKGTNPKAQAPTPLNFAELAEGKDLVGLELNSVTPLQALREDIGKSFRVISAQTGGSRTVPFVDFAYADSLPLLKPEINQDNESNFYLFWKTAEEPAYVPPLDQVRDEVVRAWKMVKARDLARKRAEEYAAQARSLNKPLAESFGKQPELNVAELAPFSWLTLGNVPAESGGMPRLSDVAGLDQAGPEFMQTVFGLQPGGLGVAMNVPEDTVYVIRVLEFEPPQEQLRDEFARESPDRYVAAAREDRLKIYRDWIEDINKEANVTWLRQADVRVSSPAADTDEF